MCFNVLNNVELYYLCYMSLYTLFLKVEFGMYMNYFTPELNLWLSCIINF